MSVINGAIPVTGFIGPTDSNDTYAVTDAIFGIDGYRSVSAITARNSITLERRREGMLVYTQDDKNIWQLLQSPWTNTNSDWKLFISSAATASLSGNSGFLSLSGGTITGDTLVTQNFTAATYYSGSTSLQDILNMFSGGTGGGGGGFSGWTGSFGISSIIANNGTNQANGDYAIAGGKSNIADGTFSVAIGGYNNLASGGYSFIGSGNENKNYGNYSIIVGGQQNLILSNRSFIGCGNSNTATTKYSFIGNGISNLTSGYYSTVINGKGNLTHGKYSLIGGGVNNRIMGSYAYNTSIIGGKLNMINGAYTYNSSIIGGYSNSATTSYSSVIAGIRNTVSGTASGIFAGKDNIVSGSYSIVLGGRNITATDNDTIYAPSARLAETFGSVIYSANTDLYNIFMTSAGISSNFLSLGGGVVTGNTLFTTGVTANTLTLNTTTLAPLNTNIFFTDPSPINNGDIWVSSGISGIFLNVRVAGITKSVELA